MNRRGKTRKRSINNAIGICVPNENMCYTELLYLMIGIGEKVGERKIKLMLNEGKALIGVV